MNTQNLADGGTRMTIFSHPHRSDDFPSPDSGRPMPLGLDDDVGDKVNGAEQGDKSAIHESGRTGGPTHIEQSRAF